MPRYRSLVERQQQSQKRHNYLRKKYCWWTRREQRNIKNACIQIDKRLAKEHRTTVIPPSFLDDFRSQWDGLFDGRIDWQRSGNGYLRAGVSRSIYFSLIHPKLVNLRYWMAHWGDWAVPQFNFRVLGEITNMDNLQAIFGEMAVCPREREDLGGYNTDPTEGEIVGFLCLLDLSEKFTFSYDVVRQMLKITFVYKTYRWVAEEGEDGGSLQLILFSNGDNQYHPNGPKFLVKGLQVSIFWEEFQQWYSARVKRWSKAKSTWVLKYDCLQDTVYKDVPVWKWQFLT